MQSSSLAPPTKPVSLRPARLCWTVSVPAAIHRTTVQQQQHFCSFTKDTFVSTIRENVWYRFSAWILPNQRKHTGIKSENNKIKDWYKRLSRRTGSILAWKTSEHKHQGPGIHKCTWMDCLCFSAACQLSTARQAMLAPPLSLSPPVIISQCWCCAGTLLLASSEIPEQVGNG